MCVWDQKEMLSRLWKYAMRVDGEMSAQINCSGKDVENPN